MADMPPGGIASVDSAPAKICDPNRDSTAGRFRAGLTGSKHTLYREQQAVPLRLARRAGPKYIALIAIQKVPARLGKTSIHRKGVYHVNEF